MAIALAFLALSIAVGDAVASYFAQSRFADVLREGFLIGGWVAMWRPLEVFFYDWWPIRADARLFDRLGALPVRIHYEERLTDAWRSDWPAGAQIGESAAVRRSARVFHVTALPTSPCGTHEMSSSPA